LQESSEKYSGSIKPRTPGFRNYQRLGDLYQKQLSLRGRESNIPTILLEYWITTEAISSLDSKEEIASSGANAKISVRTSSQ
jgi:hypothetical protein